LGDVIEAMLELWNGGDLAAVEGVYTDPIRLGGIERPRSEVARVLTSSRAAFPDQRYQVEDRIDGRDRVVLRLRWSATHTGDWQSSFGLFRATSRRFAVSVLELYELAEGRIAGAWVGFDIRELLRQLGIELVPGDQARKK
jgi:predicted ester cyclase